MKYLFTKTLSGVPAYRWIALTLLGLILFGVSIWIRGRLDIEWNLESIRTFVESLNYWGPLVFIAILTFRFLFLIPTGLLLVASGILFGPIYGTLYAGIGMFGSGLLKFGFASVVGRDIILRQLPIHLQNWVNSLAAKKVSLWALMGVCAYPFLPKHIFQFAAILSGMGFLVYVSAVCIGSFVRAGIFANIGEAIYSGEGLVMATAIILTLLVLPMSHGASRRWLLGPLNSQNPQITSKEILS